MSGFTRRAIEAAMRKVDGGRPPITLRDSRLPGLSLAVGKASARWRLDYKLPLPGGRWSAGKRLVLGDLATMDIDTARDAAAAAKAQIANGIDPVAAKRARRETNIEASASRTVVAAIERFIEERSPDWSQATCRSFRGDLALIRRSLGEAPLALVTRPALVELVETFLAEQRAAGARGVRRATRIAHLLGALWRQAGNGTRSRPGWGWPGVDPHVAERLPVAGRDKVSSRRRVLSEREIAAAWQTLQAKHPRVGAAPRLVLMLSLATGLRIGAIALTRVADLDLDPEPIVGARDNGPTIRIPAADGRKASARDRREGADLILPLSAFAVSLWREALALGRGGGAYVFPGTKGRPLSTNTVSKAWRLLGVPANTVAHDVRRSMRTHLGDMDHGGSFEDEERLIGHTVGNTVARAYDRGRRLVRLRAVANAWGRRLEEIVSRPPAAVIEIRGRPW